MSLPPIAPLPPASVRLSIAPEEWGACLDAWLSLVELNLRAPAKQLEAHASNGGPLLSFLQSYYRELAQLGHHDRSLTGPKANALHKVCFSLTARILLETGELSALLQGLFLSHFCRAHPKSTALARLLGSVWRRKGDLMQKVLQREKAALLQLFEKASPEELDGALRHLAPVLRASPEAGAFYMTGSDFVDSLLSCWSRHGGLEPRKPLLTTAYFGLLSLVKTDPPKLSMLSDHLYTLKSQADSTHDQPSLMAGLVTNTPLIAKLRASISGNPTERLAKLLEALETYRNPSLAQPRRHQPRRHRNKGKGPATQLDGELHMHRLSLVTQVQDLFPNLGWGFILKLLDEYQDDVEQVTAHLLDDSLPPHLSDVDRTEHAPIFDVPGQNAVENLAPVSTPPARSAPCNPKRRNVFDDDELDRLQHDTARLHFGKKPDAPTAGIDNKAAIFSALAAFDADDDERDDTYDVEDVGGTVDTTHPDGEPGLNARITHEENELAMFKAYKASPALFGRTFDVRRGQARQNLKAETGWSDEQVEGWAVMLQRDPKRLQRLERQSGATAFDGRQNVLEPTSYRESPAGTETEDSDALGSGDNVRGRGGGRRGRESGRGGRGRGGSVAGPSRDVNTANAQRRKEANKSSRANHNRRDQRARKMGRGGT